MSFTLTIKERGHSWAGRPPLTTVHATRAEAEAELLKYVQLNWESEMGTDPPNEPTEMIAEYFSEVLEAYEVRESGG